MAKINQINIDNTIHDIGVKAENIDGKINWDKIDNKPSVYVPAEHTHDNRYYTETEIDNKINTLNSAIDSRVLFKNENDGGFRVIAYSRRTFSATSLIEVVNEYIREALKKFGSNITFSGNIYKSGIIDGYISGNVWGDSDGTIHSACAFLLDVDGKIYRYNKTVSQNNATIEEISTLNFLNNNYYTAQQVENRLNANGAYYLSSKGGFGNTNIDTLKFQGVYQIDSGPQGQPGTVIVCAPHGNNNEVFAVQFFIPWNTGFFNSYVRLFTNNVWYEWARISTAKNSPHLKIKDYVWSNVVLANTSTTFTIPCPQIDGYRAIGIINVWVTYPETIEVPFYSLINSGTDILYKVRSTYGENLTNNTEFRILYAADDCYAFA